ncbi:heme-binding protein 1-like [Anneissia japonica]|uniref:heme-binding protein 1-like n=1 Tax=Anneissia japonica TaxID=1529436 RepID=UPI0014256689|nr:heme-binding protein 1-like [Anneissia japonica]
MFRNLAERLFSETEEPKYKVVNKFTEKGKEYEERQYESCRWIVTKVTGKNYKDSSGEGFIRLFKYISGENKEGNRISMTAPVVIYCQPANEDWKECADELMVGFFVPQSTKQLPTSKTDNITFRDSPAHTVFVRTFNGFAKEEDYMANAKILKSAINDSSCYRSDFFYACGYDSPMKLVNRRNEVWLLKK